MASKMFVLNDRNKIICCANFIIHIKRRSEWDQRASHGVEISFDDTAETLYEGTELECTRWMNNLMFNRLRIANVRTANEYDMLIEIENTLGSVNGISEFVAQKCEKRTGNVLTLDYVYDQYLRFAKHEFPLAPIDPKSDTEKEMHNYPTKDEFIELLYERSGGFATTGIDEGQYVEDIAVNDSLDSPVVDSNILQKIQLKRQAMAAYMA